ncbi:fibronectin type III domain-containing protein [Microvirga sp. STR05]|uniref:Fibronectin type III domain-containing protein n=1 Tax=Hymenobacter duratus TaxID=2771356 RepID=A0ABR8JES7_9BACT|nr:fibronectin type III domain-containing protein [Hymenobacter duratus]MBD2714236.1 fibronectin type III domain-containing protein [Hymenobacter duratus]MBR7949138.1 fibronectin type III domain-containing protein [Microvirga sp. STR05]
MHTPLQFNGHTTTRWPGTPTPQPWATRLLLLLGLWLAAATGAWAQVAGYGFAASSGTYTTIEGTTGATNVAGVQVDTGISGALPIGFSFVFDGVTYTEVRASSNGFLSFNASAGSQTTNNLNTVATSSRPLVAPLWDDLDGRATVGGVTNSSRAIYSTTGTAPNRVFTFEWKNWEWNWSSTNPVISFQAKLYEGTNVVQFVYQPESGAVSSGSASAGLSGISSGQFLSLNNLSAAATVSSTTETTTINAKPVAGQIYTFTPPSCAAPSGIATNSVTSTSANVTFTASASATSYTVTYTPAGGTATTVTPAPTASPVALTGLTPSTAYSVSIVSNCAGGQTSSAVTTSFTTLSPPPANDDCAGAISLTSDETCVPVTGSTLGATQSLPGIACDGFTGNADDDVWYSFVATNTQHTVRVQGNTSFDAVVDVRSGTCASSANIGCADATTGGGLETAVLPGLTIGATYYVRVYSYTGTAPSTAANGGFTICITNPANVPCAQVTNAAVTAASTTGQLTFTAATGATNYTLTLTPTAGGPTSTATLSGSPVNLTGLTPSTAYTVTITTNCSNGGVSTPVTVNFTTLAPPPAPANDECAGAISLSSSTTCTPTAGSTLGATASTAAGTCVGNADDDVWYSFVATNTSHTIRVVGATGFDAVVNLRSGACPGVNVGSCQDGSGDGGTETITATSLTVGATYYVRVFDYYAGSGSGDFTICITNPSSCTPPTAAGTNSVTQTSANVTFTASASATSYTVTYTPAGGTATTVTPAPTASPVALTGLTPGTAYSVSIVSNCAGGLTSSAVTTSFTTLSPPPANDDCANATAIACGQTLTGTTVGATNTGEPTTACGGTNTPSASPSVFYSFTGTGDIVTVTTCGAGTTIDTELFVYSGSCGALTCVDGNDDFSGCSANSTASQVTFTSVAGTQYYFMVQRFSSTSATGAFSLSLTCTPPPTCAAPTGVAAGSITQTGASISFTPSATATSYTATATPTTGSPVTVTGTASPLVLTGLSSGTAYSVTVTSTCAGGLTATSTPAVTFTTLFPQPSNDDCATATALTSSTTCVTTTGTTIGATASTAAGACAGTADDDVWYSFVATNTSHTIRVVGATGFDAVVNLRSGACPGTTVGSCQDNTGSGGTETITATGLTVGDTYLVRVYSYSSTAPTTAASGGFTICITNPASCAAPTAASTNSVTQTSANVTFTASASATDYTVTYTPAGGTATTVSPNPTASPVALTGLTPGTAYSVSIVSNCAGGQTSSAVTTSFTTLSPPPANDDCANAIALTPGAAGAACSAISGTTTGATASTAAGTCVGTADDDVWYSFVATNTSHTIRVVGATGFDAVVNLRSGACPGTTVGSCQDNTGSGGTETITATGLTVGDTYLVRVFEYFAGSGSGSFTICVTTPAAPVCNAPTAAATNSVTQTSANVTFTASASATSYTVTYTPAGGTATTVSPNPTASPVALTGLTPNTAYSVSIVSNCAGGLTSSAVTTSFTTLAAAPQDLTVSNPQNVQGTYNNVTITGTGVATLTGPLTVNGVLTVQTGGVLVQNCQVINGTGSFVLQAGAELRICDVAGIAATGATGAVQVTGTRTFSNDANYVYNGTAPQAAGPGLPARVRNLTVNNATGLRLTQALNVAEVVRLTSGNLTLNSNALTLLSSAAGTALVDNTGGLVIGQATVQRYIDPSLNSGLGYRHYSSPVFSTTIADLTTAGFSPVVNNDYNISATPLAVSPFPTVFSYEQARVATNNGAGLTPFDKGWTSPTSTGEPMAVGRGYTVNIAASALVDFVGSLNSGTISTLPLARGTQPDAGWHLVGNPYPSPLDWSTVSIPAGLNGAIYVHQSPSQYGTNYRSYQNGVGGNPLIASAQGFFVRTSTAGATPTLTLTNANRVTSFAQQVSFNRGPETRPLLQLAVRNTAGTSLDDTYVYFEQGATAGIDDRYDAYKLRNSSSNLSTVVGSEEMSINGLAPLTGAEVVVPLRLSVPQAGTYTFQAAQLLNFGTGAEVFLRDAQSGTLQSLSQQPNYTFTLGSASSATRFSLVFRGTTALGTGTGLLAAQVAVFPNPAHHSFQLTMPAVVGGKSVKATLLNSLGQVITERTLPVTSTGVQAQFDVQHLAQGVYILRMETASGPVTKRVTVE